MTVKVKTVLEEVNLIQLLALPMQMNKTKQQMQQPLI